jgi:hypothetical protein
VVRRELGYVLILGLVGLVLAALVVLVPWYPGTDAHVVRLVVPGGIVGQP